MPGGVTPKLVTRAMVVGMRPGSVIVDISIDQGGCCETSRQTTLTEHTYIEVGVTHSRRKFKSVAAQTLHNCAIAHRGELCPKLHQLETVALTKPYSACAKVRAWHVSC